MAKKEESYESMMIKLEGFVQDMDSKDLTLEDSMKNYEEGIKICNRLYSILNKAEGKIKILRDGEGAEEEFLSKEE